MMENQKCVLCKEVRSGFCCFIAIFSLKIIWSLKKTILLKTPKTLQAKFQCEGVSPANYNL